MHDATHDEQEAVRADLARRLAADDAEVDAETVERTLLIRQVLVARFLDALRAPLPAAPVDTAALPVEAAPVDTAALPAAVSIDTAPPLPAPASELAAGELSDDDKLRMLRAYAEQRKAMLTPRSELVRPRRRGLADTDAPADTTPALGPLCIQLDERATTIGRERLHLGTTPSARRIRRRLAFE